MNRLTIITGILVIATMGCRKEATPPQPQTISEKVSMGTNYANDIF